MGRGSFIDVREEGAAETRRIGASTCRRPSKGLHALSSGTTALEILHLASPAAPARLHRHCRNPRPCFPRLGTNQGEAKHARERPAGTGGWMSNPSVNKRQKEKNRQDK